MSEQATPSPSSPAIDPTLQVGELDGAFLGEGAQYQVYDMGDGHVRKVPQSLEGAMQAVGVWHKGTPQEIEQYAHMVMGFRDQGAAYVRELTTKYPEARPFFGNPQFQEDGSIIQDKLTPLGEMLASDTPAAFEAIDKYLDSVVKSWEYGCFDWVFNLAANTATDGNGNIVMMDFGEMGFDLSTLNGVIDKKAWSQSYDAQHRLHPEVKGYFLGATKWALSKDRAARHWRKRLS